MLSPVRKSALRQVHLGETGMPPMYEQFMSDYAVPVTWAPY